MSYGDLGGGSDFGFGGYDGNDGAGVAGGTGDFGGIGSISQNTGMSGNANYTPSTDYDELLKK